MDELAIFLMLGTALVITFILGCSFGNYLWPPGRRRH